MLINVYQQLNSLRADTKIHLFLQPQTVVQHANVLCEYLLGEERTESTRNHPHYGEELTEATSSRSKQKHI